MKKTTLTLITAIITAIITAMLTVSAQAIPTQAVQVGGDADHDACGGWGIATVSTTLFTSIEGHTFDRIEASQEVIFCDSMSDSDGEYTGVILPEEGKDCGVSSPIEKIKNYDGPCKSGWVKTEYLLLIAG